MNTAAIAPVQWRMHAPGEEHNFQEYVDHLYKLDPEFKRRVAIEYKAMSDAQDEIGRLQARLREVETLWEGAEAVIASQAQELVEVVDKLAQAEQERASWRRMAEELEHEMAQAEQRVAAETLRANTYLDKLKAAKQRVAELEQGEAWRETQYRAGIREKAVLEQRVVGLEAALQQIKSLSKTVRASLWSTLERSVIEIALTALREDAALIPPQPAVGCLDDPEYMGPCCGDAPQKEQPPYYDQSGRAW